MSTMPEIEHRPYQPCPVCGGRHCVGCGDLLLPGDPDQFSPDGWYLCPICAVPVDIPILGVDIPFKGQTA